MISKILKNIRKEIKENFKKGKIKTSLSVLALVFALLSLFKPNYSSDLVSRIGFSLLQILIFIIIILGLLSLINIKNLWR